jgi:mRNA interferase HigB
MTSLEAYIVFHRVVFPRPYGTIDVGGPCNCSKSPVYCSQYGNNIMRSAVYGSEHQSGGLALRVVGVEDLLAFCHRHTDVDQQVKAWIAEAKEARWSRPADIKGRYPSASLLAGDRVVFNLKGNRYRLVVRVNYKIGIVKVQKVGTHADYDKWNL